MREVIGAARRAVVGSLALLWSVGLPAVADAVAQYEITDLGTLGGSSSTALSINASGQVVGWAQNASGNKRAFLWDKGVMRDLGTLGGPTSGAYDVNDSGQVVGWARFSTDFHYHAFLWEGGAMQDLGALAYGDSWAYALNNSGQVVGATASSTGWPHAFLWDDGVMNDLGTLGRHQSVAMGINDLGQVVGQADTSEATEGQAFLWENGVMRELGVYAGLEHSAAHDINDSGQIVGTARKVWSSLHAALWEDGALEYLDAPDTYDSSAWGINALGQVVGWMLRPPTDNEAVLWQDGVMYRLESLVPSDSGWLLTRAESINDRGQIVGNGLHNGLTRAFLLTPIPEPSALGFLGCAFLVAVRRSPRRRGRE